MQSETYVEFSKNIPVRYNPDVFIAGGGPAGVAAALAARKAGASVYLAEGQSCFGGAGTAGLVPDFVQFSNGVDFLAAGVGSMIFNRLNIDGKADPSKNIPIKVELLKRIYDELMQDSGAEFTFQTHLVGVGLEKTPQSRIAAVPDTSVGPGPVPLRKVSYAVLAARSGIFAVKAGIYIDCTGDGDLTAWAGAPFMKGGSDGKMVAGTLCSLWAGIMWDKVSMHDRKKMLTCSKSKEALKNKTFSMIDKHLIGMSKTGNMLGGGNIGHIYGVDGTDEKSLTEALIYGRKQVAEYEKYYREYLAEGYSSIELAATGAMLGIRETRRIIGDYILNVEDFRKKAVFEDEIGRYCYPVDIHPAWNYEDNNGSNGNNCGSGKHVVNERNSADLKYAPGESYGIPYRCLTPVNISNILTAGRCISTDRYMQGTTRVMPGCFITGQAAGIAAALAARNGCDVRGTSICEIQNALKSIGAFLPNT